MANASPGKSSWVALHSDLLLCVVLILAGAELMWSSSPKLDAAAVATLVGAMYGGAAVLFGNWLQRRSAAERELEERERRGTRLKTLIAAELVDVAAGLISAKEFLDVSIQGIHHGMFLGDFAVDVSRHFPRAMPFTANLGIELLVLEQPAIDALVTLRSNLTETTHRVTDLAAAQVGASLLTVGALKNGIAHDMKILATAFKHIAPERKLQLPGQQPKLASAILEEKADS